MRIWNKLASALIGVVAVAGLGLFASPASAQGIESGWTGTVDAGTEGIGTGSIGTEDIGYGPYPIRHDGKIRGYADVSDVRWSATSFDARLCVTDTRPDGERVFVSAKYRTSEVWIGQWTGTNIALSAGDNSRECGPAHFVVGDGKTLFAIRLGIGFTDLETDSHVLDNPS